MQLRMLLSLGPFEILCHDGEGEDLVLSFASIGHDEGRHPSPEFVAAAVGQHCGKGRSALFISDLSRSWANDPHFDDSLRQALTALPRPPRRMLGVGVSMGAFSALAASRVLALDAVIAIAPQWSVDPTIMPEERRWRRWQEAIPAHRWQTCPLPEAKSGCQSYLLHAGGADLDHARRFPLQANVDHLIFEDHAHSDLGPALKARGVLGGLIDAGLAGDRRRALRILSSAGGVRRRGPDLPLRS